MYKQILILLISISFLTISCDKDDDSNNEDEDLKTYIQENDITNIPTESGLYYIETTQGTGSQAVAGKTVRVNYKGYFLNGDIFDEGLINFVLGDGKVIAGWDEGISYMKENGKAKLIIPSKLAYGSTGTSNGTIPPYSTLIFDIELITVSD